MRTVRPGPFVVVAAIAASAAAQRTPDTRVNTNPPGGAVANHPIVHAAGDRIDVVWQDSRSGVYDVRWNRSLDRGATWLAADVQVDVGLPAAHSIAPAFAADGATLHVVWEDLRNHAQRGDVYYNRSLDGGATWLAADVRLDTGDAPGAAASTAPQVVCAGASVCVVWSDARNGATDVYANRSLDGGTTWLSAAVRVDTGDAPGSSVSTAPRVGAGNGAVHVVWEDERSGNRDILWNRSLDGGASWLATSPRLDHGPTTAYATEPQLRCSGSHVCAVWLDDRNGLKDVYSNRSLDGGASWLPNDQRIDTDPPGTGDSHEPRLAGSGSTLHVVWEDYRSWVWPQIYYRRSLDGGTTWVGGDAMLNTTTTSPCASREPSIAADGTFVVAAWLSLVCGGAGGSDIWCRRSLDGGASWSTNEVRLDTDVLGARASVEPRVAVVADRCHVVWSDFRFGQGRQDLFWNVPFGLLPYGAGSPGSGGPVPRLTGLGSAALGTTVSLAVDSAVGGALGALLVGGPGSKTSVPFAGGAVLVAPFTSVGLVLGGAVGVAGAGSGSLPLTIPPAPSLAGYMLAFQGIFLDPGAAAGLSLTNGVEAWFG